MSSDFQFRGSLGDVVRGRDGFRAYRDRVRAAFPDYENGIVSLVGQGDQAAAQMEFRGTHRGEVFGYAPTGRRVAYRGAAFFRLSAGKLASVWVVADLDGLRTQLAGK